LLDVDGAAARLRDFWAAAPPPEVFRELRDLVDAVVAIRRR